MPNRVGTWLLIGLLSLLGIEVAMGVRGGERTPDRERTRPTTWSTEGGNVGAHDGGDGVPTPPPFR